MSRVPNFPPRPIAPILTLADHRKAGFSIVSICSTGNHQHLVDLDAQIALHGSAVEPDYEWRKHQTCPECGAPGGSLIVQQIK